MPTKNDKFETTARYQLHNSIDKILDSVGDKARFVYSITNDPYLSLLFLKFDKRGQIVKIRKTMENQSESERHRYMENILKKGTEDWGHVLAAKR